jgi:nitroreductase
MEFLSTENLKAALNWRYATKMFDPNKKIDEKTWKALEDSLILTPSSYGITKRIKSSFLETSAS